MTHPVQCAVLRVPKAHKLQRTVYGKLSQPHALCDRVGLADRPVCARCIGLSRKINDCLPLCEQQQIFARSAEMCCTVHYGNCRPADRCATHSDASRTCAYPRAIGLLSDLQSRAAPGGEREKRAPRSRAPLALSPGLSRSVWEPYPKKGARRARQARQSAS